MDIVNKIKNIQTLIKDGGAAGDELANTMGDLATKAIRYGMESREWETYMKRFTTDPAELNRLLGKDEKYNDTDWCYQTLAYIVANSPCTSLSSREGTGTVCGLTDPMLADLDADL